MNQIATLGSSGFASPLNPPAPQSSDLHGARPSLGRQSWRGLHGSAPALAVARAASKHDALTIVVTADTLSAEQWTRQIKFFAEDELAVLRIPDWETLPYDAFSPHQDIISERLASLQRLPSLGRGVLIVPMATALQRLVPRQYIDAHSIDVAVGQQFELEQQRRRLDDAGYQSVDTVSGRGEYAVRGSLMDIFPIGTDWPIRIDLFDDEIESLRRFDPETQRTTERIDALTLMPAKEFPLDADSVRRFRANWHANFDVDVRRCSVYQDISQGLCPSGIEYYLPFFFDELATLFDYLPDNSRIFAACDLNQALEANQVDIQERYESLGHDIERPIVAPKHLWLASETFFAHLKAYPLVDFNDDGKHGTDFDTVELSDVHANHRASKPAQALTQHLEGSLCPVLFVAESAGRREVLDEFLRRAGLQTQHVDSFSGFSEHIEARQGQASPSDYWLTVGALEQPLQSPSFEVITEFDLLGSRPAERRAARNRVMDPEQIVRNLTELQTGAPVVHIDHGVGRYLGLTTLTIDGKIHEFLELAYADEAKLYVPVTSLHLIGRYSGNEAALAPLHRLGSDTWDKAKRKAAERAYDAAAELLNIYARRKAKPGFVFGEPGADYERFVNQFAFEATPDQDQAIADVIADLCAEKTTDRLICGDVGFGKTEVAMRAAFVAVQSGRQVAILVPTTLLAQQHFESFQDRFADWPVNIEVVSRMRSEGDISATAERLHSGATDILIGTHRLLNPKIRFADLGLVIIDEEHRFGVRQKERLKALRAEVDVITLTATPIPRTLNLAMSGLRDLSIIATPPAKRLSIKTFVQEKRNHVLKEAIHRELQRGGQVFYVHNEVKSIERVGTELAKALPEARVGIGHGQMPKRDLERVMSEFYHRQINVLVCTTIIENGIDIPNANTIIIDRADKFGLAQLHQLRGRVGRSSRQAYAYLLTPEPKAMTADARKRLEALEASGELGVGFTLATHDLEIRGAGELLGEDQSGQIEAVGYAMYMDLLDRAVKAIQEGKAPDLDHPLEPTHHEVNLHTPALIPDDYLPDVHSRLILYKRIASTEHAAELDELKVEIIDRFGSLPEAVRRLFQITQLKHQAAALGIDRIDLGETGGRFEFRSDTRVDPMAIVKLVQQEPGRYRLDGATVLRIKATLADFQARFDMAETLFAKFRPNADQ
ncbi:MAG: transcription-repair coupling factor [Pseudomonadales bacterium]